MQYEIDMNSVRLASARRHTRAALSNVDARSYTHMQWVVWGEEHTREAVASSLLAMAVNLPHYPFIQCHLRVLGDKEYQMAKEAVARNDTSGRIHVTAGKVPAPTNPAMFDIERFRVLAEDPSDRQVIYMDSDIYCFEPFDLSRIRGHCTLFAMGKCCNGMSPNKIHERVDKLIGRSSSVFYASIGVTRDMYSDNDAFWPWLRYNIGMFHVRRGGPWLSDFARLFEQYHQPFAASGHFGVGELILTSMANAGLLPGFKVDLTTGWAATWSFQPNKTKTATIVLDKTDTIVTDLIAPTGKPIMHCGHFTDDFFFGMPASKKPMRLTLDRDLKPTVAFQDAACTCASTMAFAKL